MTPDEIDQIADAVVARLADAARVDAGGIDWSQIRYPEFTAGQLRPECSDLGEMPAFKVMVSARLKYKGSAAQLIRTAVMKYLRELWKIDIDAARPIAAREGLTLEECMSRIADGTLKP
jgi:hypothetical protein